MRLLAGRRTQADDGKISSFLHSLNNVFFFIRISSFEAGAGEGQDYVPGTHCTKYYCSAKRKHKLRSPIVCTSSSEKNRQNLYHVLVEEKWSQRQARVTCEHQESKTVGSRATRFYHLPLYFRQKQTSRESPTPPTSKQVHMFESTKLQNLLASATQSSAWRWSGWLIGSNDLILEERDQML